jgi:hypothetical protein
MARSALHSSACCGAPALEIYAPTRWNVVSTAGNKGANDGPPNRGIELQLAADTAYALTQARDVIGLDAAKRSDLVDE